MFPEASSLPVVVPERVPSVADGEGVTTHVSYAVDALYTSIQGLRDAADLVVIGTPTGKTTTVAVEQPKGSDIAVTMAAVEYTIVRTPRKDVDEVGKGAKVWVVQPFPNSDLLPEKSGYVLLYLQEYVYWLGDQRPTDGIVAYVPVGADQGVWLDLEGKGTRFTKTARVVEALPDNVTDAEGRAP